MGKLILLNVLVVVLAVYASAKYTFQNEDTGKIDEEIDAISRALNSLEGADKRQGGEEGTGGENEDGDDDGDDDGSEDDDSLSCEDVCDDECKCLVEECEEECLSERQLDTRQPAGVQKKFFGRFRRVFRRIRVPRFRVPRIRLPRIRFRRNRFRG